VIRLYPMPRRDKAIPMCPQDGTHGLMSPNIDHDLHEEYSVPEWFCQLCGACILVNRDNARAWMVAIARVMECQS
jgi:hypothetical protein